MMILKCQTDTLSQLRQFAQSDRHSVLIEGPQGCGKSYLAAEYGKLLGIADVVTVNATVSDLRSMLDSCYSIETPVVVCIEGLDGGQLSSSYVILKFLEEPKSNVYMVITCSNIYRIPDTILSRSVVATIGHPTTSELVDYMKVKYPERLDLLQHPVSKAFMTFKDIDIAVKLTTEELQYYEEISYIVPKDSVSSISWKLGHYEAGGESNLVFVLRCIMNSTSNKALKLICIETLKEIEMRRMSLNAILSKFAFDFKYGV